MLHNETRCHSSSDSETRAVGWTEHAARMGQARPEEVWSGHLMGDDLLEDQRYGE
jgi:hypothetical protein